MMSPPPAHDSAVAPCLHSCLSFLQTHFLLQSSPSCSLRLSSTVDSSLCPGIALQPLHSSSQLLHIPAVLHPLSGIHRAVAQIVWSSLHADCHRSTASLSNSLKCFPFIPTDCPNVESSTPLQLSHPLGAGPVCSLFSLFPFLPSSYRVLCESIDSFLVVRDSCQFSAGALGGLLHLKMYS